MDKKGYIQIIRPSGGVAIEVPISRSSYIKKTLGGDDELSLDFFSDIPVFFERGCTIKMLWDDALYSSVIDGRMLYDNYPAPLKSTDANGGYKYNLKFYTNDRLLSDTNALFLQKDGDLYGEIDWSITAQVDIVANILLRNMKRAYPEVKWSLVCPSGGESRQYNFNRKSVKEAFLTLAQESGYIFSVSGGEIRLVNLDDVPSPHVFSYQEFDSCSFKNPKPIRSLYVSGGKKNLPMDYKYECLSLSSPVVSNVNGAESSCTFEDIYPQIFTSVSSVRHRSAIWKDSESEEHKEIPVYRITCDWKPSKTCQSNGAPFVLHTGLIASGKKLKCYFNSGKLAGMEFDCIVPVGDIPGSKEVILNDIDLLIKQFDSKKLIESDIEILGRVESMGNQLRNGARTLRSALPEFSGIMSTASSIELQDAIGNLASGTIDLVAPDEAYWSGPYRKKIQYEESGLSDGDIEILPNDDYGVVLPNKDLFPENGDDVSFVNYYPDRIHKDALADAENRLRQKAKEHIEKLNNNICPISVTSRSIHLEPGTPVVFNMRDMQSRCIVSSTECKLYDIQCQTIVFDDRNAKTLFERLASNNVRESPFSSSLSHRRDYETSYSAGKYYHVGDRVFYKDSVYTAVRDGVLPSPGTSHEWMPLTGKNAKRTIDNMEKMYPVRFRLSAESYGSNIFKGESDKHKYILRPVIFFDEEDVTELLKSSGIKPVWFRRNQTGHGEDISDTDEKWAKIANENIRWEMEFTNKDNIGEAKIGYTIDFSHAIEALKNAGVIKTK